MKQILLMLSLVLGLAGVARAQEADIRGVISGQIAAFQADDFETAFDFASGTIRRLFGTSENFGRMVRDGYPMVYRPAEVTFLQLGDRAGAKAQRVMMRDGAGALHVLEYQMIETENGWKINGVRILDVGGVGA
jgi:hypothetical protein